MKVLCLRKTGEALRPYEYESISNKEVFGRFRVSAYGRFEVVVGREYRVMGIIVFKTHQAYLVDDNDFISACPCQLFEIIDDTVDSNWHFRMIDKSESIYPAVQAILGYPELCSDLKAYQNLLQEFDSGAKEIYFRRKAELDETLKD